MIRVSRTWVLRACARLLIGAYALFIFSPAAPVVMDKAAHTFWRASHYRLVHSHNGHAHVHDEMRKAADAGNDKASGHAQGWTKNVSPHTVAQVPALPTVVFAKTQVGCAWYCVSYRSTKVGRDYPPPEA